VSGRRAVAGAGKQVMFRRRTRTPVPCERDVVRTGRVGPPEVRRICLLCGGGYTYRRFGEVRPGPGMDAGIGPVRRQGPRVALRVTRGVLARARADHGCARDDEWPRGSARDTDDRAGVRHSDQQQRDVRGLRPAARGAWIRELTDKRHQGLSPNRFLPRMPPTIRPRATCRPGREIAASAGRNGLPPGRRRRAQ